MDYLTNYYKNLCEERQEKIKILEHHLNEINMSDFLEIGRQIVNAPSDGGFSRGIGRITSSIGSGVKKTGEMLTNFGSNVQRTGQQEIEASKQFNIPELARQGHSASLHFDAQKIIKNDLPFIEQQHRESIAIEAGGDSDDEITDAEIEAQSKKRGNKNRSRKELAELVKKEKIKTAETTIPSRVLGTIAQKIHEKSGQDIERRQERLQNRGSELWYRPSDTPRGIEQHHGGHGEHMAHPELKRLQSEASNRNLDLSDAFKAFENHDTHHVAEEFEYLLPKELVKLNKKNKNNFNQAISQVQQLIDLHDQTQRAVSTSAKEGTPFKMMESKNTKRFKKFLIENSHLSEDTDYSNYRSPSDYGSRLPLNYGSEPKTEIFDYSSPHSILEPEHPIHSNNIQQYPREYLLKAHEHLSNVIEDGSLHPEHHQRLNLIKNHLLQWNLL